MYVCFLVCLSCCVFSVSVCLCVSVHVYICVCVCVCQCVYAYETERKHQLRASLGTLGSPGASIDPTDHCHLLPQLPTIDTCASLVASTFPDGSKGMASFMLQVVNSRKFWKSKRVGAGCTSICAQWATLSGPRLLLAGWLAWPWQGGWAACLSVPSFPRDLLSPFLPPYRSSSHFLPTSSWCLSQRRDEQQSWPLTRKSRIHVVGTRLYLKAP